MTRRDEHDATGDTQEDDQTECAPQTPAPSSFGPAPACHPFTLAPGRGTGQTARPEPDGRETRTAA